MVVERVQTQEAEAKPEKGAGQSHFLTRGLTGLTDKGKYGKIL
jgi:hypothetical protein